jgi:hypothetical protein
VLLSGLWVVLLGALLVRPYTQAFRRADGAAKQHGAASISFALGDILLRVLIVFGPPLGLLAFWLVTYR